MGKPMTAPLDLDQLRTFVAIVDAGSFTRAADDVFKTQSAVSMQMRRLEDRLGVSLFERTGRTIRITDGTDYLAEADDRILRRASVAKLEVFRRMYATIARGVLAGAPADAVRATEVSARLVLEMDRQFRDAWDRRSRRSIRIPFPILAGPGGAARATASGPAAAGLERGEPA